MQAAQGRRGMAHAHAIFSTFRAAQRTMFLLGSVFLLPMCSRVLAQSAAPPEKNTPPAKSKISRSNLLGLQDAFSEIAEELEPAVVTIFSTKADVTDEHSGDTAFGRALHRSTGSGSGVIIRSSGWILTNDHVVGSADRVTVRLHDGREFPGKAFRDPRSDLALIKIESPTSFPVARFGNSDTVKIGHWAIAIGSPYRYEGSFSVGVISSLSRHQEISDFNLPGGKRIYPNMIQTDAAINPGNSGGPLCNLDGEVIAINTAIESEGGGSVGIGFAIPINSAKFVIEELMAKGKVHYGYLGVSPTTVTSRLASTLTVENGALIEEEPPLDTPAAKAGIKAGDIVIAMDGRPIRTEADLRTMVAQTKPGTTITLRLIRRAKEQTVQATLIEADDLTKDDTHHAHKLKNALGMDVEPLTPELARKAHVPTKTPGVRIKAIDTISAAADNDDLTEGVVILAVNDTDTPTVREFQTALAALKSGSQVRLLCQIGSLQKVIILPVE